MDVLEHVGGSHAVFALISLIRQHRGIWDRSSPNYITEHEIKMQLFGQIAKDFNLPGVSRDTVFSAWRELTDKFRRRLYDGARRHGTTKWPYFEAMIFMQDQYEQTKWFRPLDHNQNEPSVSPSNVAQLVGSFLSAQAMLDVEQTLSKTGETPESATFLEALQQKSDSNVYAAGGDSNEEEKGRSEFSTKYELVDPAYQNFPPSQECEINANGECGELQASSAPTDSRKSAERAASPASIDNVSSQNGTIPSTSKRKRPRHDTVNNLSTRPWKVTRLSQTFRQTARTGLPENAQSASALPVPAGMLNSAQVSVIDNSAKWDNVGRVWVDMMKTIQSPQLALAAHKYIMNTLFSVLEADQQLLGSDPLRTRIRIRDCPPQFEIITHQ